MARAPAATEIEALPESDRLGDYPHPRDTKHLYGHETAERLLAGALLNGRVHHAWILGGPQGIGKATLAYRFARAALASPDERDPHGETLEIADDTRATRQVRALSHPGLLLLRRPYDEKAKRFTTSIPIDEVRRLRSFLQHRATDEGWRVVIVDDANDLNPNAANALLKSLEEPPQRTIFLLVASAPGKLLATIRSRCRVLPLNPLASEPLRKAAVQALEAISATPPKDNEWPELERIAEGSVGRLLGLLGSGGLELSQRVGAVLASLPKVDWRSVHVLSDELAPPAASARFELFFDLFSGSLERLIRAQATGEGTRTDADLAARLIGEERLASFAAVWERIGRDKAEAKDLNLDRKALIIDLVGALATAAAQDRKPA